MATWQHTLSDPFFQKGQIVTGLWNKKRYRIDGLLGSGANGEVYRVTCDGQYYALKVSVQAAEISLEHKILKQLQGVARGVDLGPLIFDLDDVQTAKGKAFFYVMEWVRGTDLDDFLQKRGPHWTPVLLLQLCTYLERLHTQGYCFGDLKAENCLVDEGRGVLRLVDFGGVTPFGRGVKEYTEWNDRAWWGQGSRLAEESYDVFALSMLVIQLLAPETRKQVGQIGPNYSLVKKSILSDPRFEDWRGLLRGVWDGRIRTVAALREALTPLVKKSVETEKKRKNKKTRHRDWTDWLLLGSAAVLVLVFCQFILAK
ncbi:protein kinase domain-containing protein [Tumebacillus permanentifrigoris]|uniref:Serine/threonine protein kinase n=1 Tax=Tumebacillus permanentifrigoris TaxID=378543 RepID=A0A316DE75_9BACL|nr:protein kinase [Tumebacillus permanentifrigoris]PWK16334.1 serine/threonine protein kinase [Tumebacillus permanentifrigoris]